MSPTPNAASLDLLVSLAEAGLTAPPGLTDFGDRLQRLGPWHWGTTAYDAGEAYAFEPSLLRGLVTDGREHLLLCHAGYGSNSYGLTLALVRGPLAVMVQHSWGGVYIDHVASRANIATTYARLHEVLQGLGAFGGPVRWMLELSMSRGVARLTNLYEEEVRITEHGSEEDLFAALEAAVQGALADLPARPTSLTDPLEDAKAAHEVEFERFGDSGPWVKHLGAVWQACAAPRPLPESPVAQYLVGPKCGSGPRGAAGWNPLMHVLMYGLGWSRPDLGLARWDRAGRPTTEPILAVTQGWWGEHLEDFLAFCAWDSFVPNRLGARFWEAAAPLGMSELNREPLPDIYSQVRATERWRQGWGGGSDPMHLSGHVDSALAPGSSGLYRTAVTRDGSGRPRAVALTDVYAGWYGALMCSDGPSREYGRNVRVDVTCIPVGWLGQYRRSAVTGLWFRGAHSTHMLGN